MEGRNRGEQRERRKGLGKFEIIAEDQYWKQEHLVQSLKYEETEVWEKKCFIQNHLRKKILKNK